MSRILLLMVFLFWMAGATDTGPRVADAPWLDIAAFLGLYAVLVLTMGLWARMLARRVASGGFGRRLRRFNNGMFVARMMIPGWFAVGVFGLGWVSLVEQKLNLAALGSVRLPGLLAGTLPALLAWVGLWWSQYPAERTLREQHVWTQLEEGTPLHAPPTFRQYFFSNLRLQVLFTLVPIILIVAARDVVATAFFHHPAHVATAMDAAGKRSPAQERQAQRQAQAARVEQERSEELIEWITFPLSAGLVFIFAPEILRRVLRTTPLPDGPLRRRLEKLCRRTGMRHRDILVWHTEFNMGNAAVMGVVPWVRYVLLSDLLLERLDDEQIEAVFAHEIGHIVHRHMVWFVVFFLILVLGTAGPATVALQWVDRLALPDGVLKPVGLLAAAGVFWVVFGYISRRFERQADVYAARVLEAGHQPPPDVRGGGMLSDVIVAASGGNVGVLAAGGPGSLSAVSMSPISMSPLPMSGEFRSHDRVSHVGRYGARLVASTLHRVGIMNNIPVSPRSRSDGSLRERVGYVVGSFMDLAHDWLHGSLAHRMAYLHGLSADPARTTRFDRTMTRLYCVLLFTLFASAAWTWMVIIR